MKKIIYLAGLAIGLFTACEQNEPVEPTNRDSSLAAIENTGIAYPQAPIYSENKTAWLFGNNYNQQENTGTYYTYDGVEFDIPIYAHPNNLVGTAICSAVVNDSITLIINLIDGWELQPGNEPVKIQGYNTPPSGNPVPEQFTTYTGSGLTVEIEAFDYYGIHFDVYRRLD